jgi:hypothetical protein
VNRFVYLFVQAPARPCVAMHACFLLACAQATCMPAGLGLCVPCMRARCARLLAFVHRVLCMVILLAFMNACAHVDACGCTLVCRVGGCTQAECVRALKALALPRASHSGEIALSSSRCLCSTVTLAAAPVLFAHAVVTVTKTVHPPSLHVCARA